MTREELDGLMNSDREKIINNPTGSYLIKYLGLSYCVMTNVSTNAECFDGVNIILKYYSIPKPADEIETLYECIGSHGVSRYVFSDFSMPDFETKRKVKLVNNEILSRKTGREFKLNMKTWEIC
jgi:hypothetical protein